MWRIREFEQYYREEPHGAQWETYQMGMLISRITNLLGDLKKPYGPEDAFPCLADPNKKVADKREEQKELLAFFGASFKKEE